MIVKLSQTILVQKLNSCFVLHFHGDNTFFPIKLTQLQRLAFSKNNSNARLLVIKCSCHRLSHDRVHAPFSFLIRLPRSC
jgi:hypothetical protein